MDPNKNTGADAGTIDPAAAAAADAGQDAPATPAADDTAGTADAGGLDGALAALDAGLAQAGEAPADAGAGDGDEGDDAVVDQPAGGDAAKDAGADAGADKGASNDVEKTEPSQPAKTAEEEATELGVKNERARARFLELRNQADKVPELERQTKELQQRASRGDQIVHAFEETGAQPQQVSSVLAYLHAVNRGDIAALTNAYEVMTKEMDWLADKLGKPRRGQDILAGHADLLEAVEDGMPRAQAEELAGRRNEAAAQQRFREQQGRATEEQNAAQERHTEAVSEAMQGLNDLEARLMATDGANYRARMDAVLAAHRDRIQALPPSRWVIETELAYLKTAAPKAEPAPAARRPGVGHVPIRQAGTGGGMGRVAASAEDALEMGLAAANRGATA